MNKWFAYLLLTAGALLLLRARGGTLSGIMGGTGAMDDPTRGGAPSPGGGSGLTVGQIGSNFYESNSLADAVQGLVSGIWTQGGQGYGGSLSIETPDGTFNYRAPISDRPLILNDRTGRLFFDP